MSNPKVDAFFIEFAFLTKNFDPLAFREVKVKRIDHSKVSMCRIGWMPDDAYSQKIFLLGEKGELITQSTMWISSRSLVKNLLGVVGLQMTGESITDMAARLGPHTARVRYVVRTMEDRSLTLYKMPTGIQNLAEFLVSHRKFIAGQLKEELEKLQAEA